MNRLLSFLFRRAPRPDTPLPETALRKVPFHPSPPEILARVDISLLMETPPGALPQQKRIEVANLPCMLEYEDAAGHRTRRRITVRQIEPGPNGPLLLATCHERRAARSFRLDRVRCVIDENGEVLAPEAFLRDRLSIDPAILAMSNPAAVAVSTSDQLRDALLAPLSILVCAAMSDHQVHRNEIDAIQLYAEREALWLAKTGKLKGPVTVEVLDPLCQMIAAMRPQHSSMRGYVATVAQWPKQRLIRLGDTLIRVIEADGRITPEELDFAAEMNVFASAKVRDRFAALELSAPADGDDPFGDPAS